MPCSSLLLSAWQRTLSGGGRVCGGAAVRVEGRNWPHQQAVVESLLEQLAEEWIVSIEEAHANSTDGFRADPSSDSRPLEY